MDFSTNSEILKLSEVDIKALLKYPETGMGYQILRAKHLNNSNYTNDEQYLITNAEVVSIFNEQTAFPIAVNFEAKVDDLDYLRDSAVINELKNYAEIKSTEYIQPRKNTGSPSFSNVSTPPYLYITRVGDEFRRLSAFRDDRRILGDGSVMPQTYGTTLSDLTVVPSGIAAVGRYALPNRIAASYVYQIIPAPGTQVYFGTVLPNYGLCGGGVEVYFPNGCDKGSARLIGTIKEM